MSRNEHEHRGRVGPQNGHDRDGVFVEKISGRDLDLTIDRLSAATAPYFRPGGLLMPREPREQS